MSRTTTCEWCGGPLPYGGHVSTPLCDACLSDPTKCDCGAALGVDHDCPLMPSCDGDEMHPLDIITVDEACS